MRHALSAAVCVIAAAAPLRAEPPLRAPIQVEAAGFKARLDDGRVIATWRRYKRADFYAYKLIKSDKDLDPSYPGSPAIFSSSGAGELRYEDGKLSAGVWHYRLCIITRFGDLWVSPAVAVKIEEKDLRRAAPTDADFE